MAISEVKPLGGNKSKFGKYRNHTTNYKIICDSVMTSFAVGLELTAYGLWYGQYAAFDPWCLAKDISLDQDELGLTWDLSIDWSSEPVTPNQVDEDGKPVASPLDAFPILDWGSRSVEVLLPHDWNAKKYENTVGLPMPPETRAVLVNRAILTVTLNEEDFDPSENDYYSGTCNSDIFFDYNPKRGMFVSKTGTKDFWTNEDGETESYYKTVTTFEFLNGMEPDLNPSEFLNVSTHIKDAGGNLINIMLGENENKWVAQEPVPITENGLAVATDATKHYLSFDNYLPEAYADFFADWGLG